MLQDAEVRSHDNADQKVLQSKHNRVPACRLSLLLQAITETVKAWQVLAATAWPMAVKLPNSAHVTCHPSASLQG